MIYVRARSDTDFAQAKYLGGNARCRANRLIELGWKPKRGIEELAGTLQLEVDAVLESIKA
jgi:hypothetical protein